MQQHNQKLTESINFRCMILSFNQCTDEIRYWVHFFCCNIILLHESSVFLNAHTLPLITLCDTVLSVFLSHSHLFQIYVLLNKIKRKIILKTLKTIRQKKLLYIRHFFMYFGCFIFCDGQFKLLLLRWFEM